MEIRIRHTGEVLNERAFRLQLEAEAAARDESLILPAMLDLDALGADPILESQTPTVADTETATRNGVTQDALGNWVQAWSVRPLTADEIEARKPPIPQQVTRRQARQALLLRGLLANVAPLIAAIADATQRALAQIEWEDSQVFERHRPLVQMIGAALGLSPAQIDELFVFAATL